MSLTSFFGQRVLAFRMPVIAIGVFALSLFVVSSVLAQSPAPAKATFDESGLGTRQPQYPLKNKRMLFTEGDIATARRHITQYPDARELQEGILKKATPWLEWSDNDLRELLDTARVPRAFDLNPKGCPLHGAEVFNKGGAYPWIIDPHRPFQVQCPVGDERYPSNDYAAYYKSGFKDKKGWDTKYVDDGWGWVAPDGERYWFVAYANHWLWRTTLEPALMNLARAYVLTGDKRYAHKTAVLLYRLAEVYPAMDYATQSREGQLIKAEGGVYPGKIVNRIWETGTARTFSEAYDAVWDTIDNDTELQKLYGKTGPQVRGYIEANLLEDAVDAYYAKKILGNFGSHQNALLHIVLARQNIDLQKYFKLLVDTPGSNLSNTGLRYALYNNIWRDGTPFESPEYNSGWVSNLSTLSGLLQRGGLNLFEEPKMKSLFESPLAMTAIGKYTPSIGDSGSVLGALIGRHTDSFRLAYRNYGDTRYLQWLPGAGVEGKNFTTFQSLFYPLPSALKPLPDGRAVAPQKPRLFAGYGLALFNNPADTIAAAFTYGYHGSHYHWDFLNFELFANGQVMMPDTGYPDAMNGYVSEVYTWSQNTVAHNTVVVDAERQKNNRPGVLHDFANAPFARSVDASSPAYPQASRYRRNLIMVDVDATRSYVVDVFRVTGGKQHDYVLHGPPGTVETTQGRWSAPAAGTLAGPQVKIGEIYDDAVLSDSNFKGPYTTYAGSGFQHLFNVQQLQSGKSLLQYQHVRDADARLRIHLLPHQSQTVYMADAYDLPRRKSHILKYLIARRTTQKSEPLGKRGPLENDKPLESTFVSVLEPYSKNAFVQQAITLKLDRGDGVVVEIKRAGGLDLIISDPANSLKTLAPYGLSTDAGSAVMTFDAQRKLQRVFFSGGTYLNCQGRQFKANSIEGTVTKIDPLQQKFIVQLAQQPAVSAEEIAQRVLYLSNQYRTCAHPLESAALEGTQLSVKTADALLVGRLSLDSVENNSFSTRTALPLAVTYAGTTLLNNNLRPIGLVKEVANGKIQLAQKPKPGDAKRGQAWLSDVRPGDKVQIKTMFSWVNAPAAP